LLAKTKLRQVPLLLPLTVMALISAPPAQAQTSNPCAETNLPSPVVALIKAKFPGWRPKQLSDLDPDNRQIWLKGGSNECPGVAVGHFESPDRLSYAVLLIPQADPIGGYKLLVFSRNTTGEDYAGKLVDHWDDKAYSGVVISRVPPGHYSDYEHARIAVTTKLDSIVLEWIEKGAILYYWSAGRYKTVRVSG
jgi:hypothetical protein